jgi:hypothetical protein
MESFQQQVLDFTKSCIPYDTAHSCDPSVVAST